MPVSPAALGTELDGARASLVAALAPGFAAAAGRLGLDGATLAYAEHGLPLAELESRLIRDLERGTTGLGPHLRDVEIRADERDLRGFGSQGEQRTAVLALLLAEAALLTERRGSPPLLLLDDVFSELDAERRRALLASLPEEGQTLITATSVDALPIGGQEPDVVLTVRREGNASRVGTA